MGGMMTPYIAGMSELDAQNHHANEDRKARNRQAYWDRVVQTGVALISAPAAIVAAYLAAEFGIEKLGANSTRFAIIDVKSASGSDVALKVDTKSGQTWVLTQTPKASAWLPVRQ